MNEPLLDQAAAVALVPRWGVFDRHTGEWPVAPTLTSEREAWAALLTVDSLHPWELIVDQQSDIEADSNGNIECPRCSGDGDCWNCQQECPHCQGYGTISAKQHAEDLAREKERADGLAQYRAEKAEKAEKAAAFLAANRAAQ